MDYIKTLKRFQENLKLEEPYSTYIEEIDKWKENEQVAYRLVHLLFRIMLWTARNKERASYTYSDHINNDHRYMQRIMEKNKIFPYGGIEGNNGNRPIQLNIEEEKKTIDNVIGILKTYL